MLSSLSKLARSTFTRSTSLTRMPCAAMNRTIAHGIEREPGVNDEEIEKVRKLEGGPFVMMNLIKIKDMDAWQKYVGTFLERFEAADIIYAGSRARDDPIPIGDKDFHDYDLIILARYPTAQDFLDISESDEYTQEVYPMRRAAVEKAQLVLTRPIPPPE